MFRASMEYNMCLFSVVGSDRKLKITPQGQYEEQNLILGANQTHGVVQGQHRVQHVTLLCGGRDGDGEVPVQQCEARKGRYSGSYFSLKRGAGRLDILIGDAGSM